MSLPSGFRILHAKLLTGLGCLISFSTLAAADPDGGVAQAGKAAASMPSQGAYLFQVLLGLIFVLALVFAAAWLLKRVGQGTLTGSGHMKIVATLPMGTRERIALVDVAGKQILLGITATTINTLHAFDEPVITEEDQSNPSDFASKIREVMAKGMVKSK
ncbi:flagellar biosynthetic protein FliO [Pseudomaricurvus sp.]|uniref:flagellar biosynthetic protein FliO n=1 Tax=Pseudomaricurvus sp. TaxID=2004510 RepID=UPI003F6C01DC